ncbi:MAG: hypothetical protein P8099_21375 [Gemmatimonadota bacterium]
MNEQEVLRLCRGLASLFPSQQFDEETPAMWGPLLENIRFADAVEATRHVASREKFISVADILGEVKKIRRDRLPGVDTVHVPADPDDVTAWLAAYRRVVAAVADGVHVDQTPPAIAAQADVRALIDGAFRAVQEGKRKQ